MNIAIIGAGPVGSTLGRQWLAAGHDVRWGLRDASKHPDLPSERVEPIGALAAWCDTLVIAVPGSSVEPVIADCGNLDDKIVIDATNPLKIGPDGLELSIGFTDSGGEQLQRLVGRARVVKALNTTGAANMARATSYSSRPAMFVAGDDEPAKEVVAQLVRELGFECFNAGPLRNARLLEPLAMLWIDQALNRGRGFDFALILESL